MAFLPLGLSIRARHTYDSVEDLKHSQCLREEHHGAHGWVDVARAVGSEQARQRRAGQDGKPQERRDGVVADEVGPLGEDTLEDAHGGWIGLFVEEGRSCVRENWCVVRLL